MRLPLLLLLLLVPLATGATVSGGGASLWMQEETLAWPQVPYLEDACFRWRNEGRTTLLFSNAAPWAIVNASGETVYRRAAADTFQALPPGAERWGCWDHEEALWRPLVPPGEYRVEWSHVEVAAGAWRMHTLRLPFTLAAPAG